VCAVVNVRVREPVREEIPDLSDSFWRIAMADQPK
jgi:hypothetical protein